MKCGNTDGAKNTGQKWLFFNGLSQISKKIVKLDKPGGLSSKDFLTKSRNIFGCFLIYFKSGLEASVC